MPARGNIAIADGAASPVTHTFTPDKDNGPQDMRWRNLNSSYPFASELFHIKWRDSTSSVADISVPGKVVAPRRVELKLKDPVTYTDSVLGLTLIDFVNEAKVELLVHPRATTQMVDDLVNMIRNSLADAQTMIRDLTDNGNGIY